MIADRRFSNPSRAMNRKAWIKIAEYKAADIQGTSDVPVEIRTHWEKNKSPWGYATFRGIEKQALKIISLARGGAAFLAINRWGEVIGYKLIK